MLNDSPRVHNGKDHKANPCYLVKGSFSSSDNDVQTCPICGQAMHVNDRLSIYLRHLPFGCVSTLLEVNSVQYILKVLALVASKFKNTNGTDYANSWLRSRYNQ